MYSVAIHISGNKLCIGFSNPQNGELLQIDQYEKVEPLDTLSIIKTLTQSSISIPLKNASKNTLYETTKRFTIVPSSFYTPESINNWTDISFKKKKNEELHSQFIPEIDSYILFPIPSLLKIELKSKIGHTEFSHHFASLISIYHLYYLEGNEPQVFIQFHSQQFSLALFDKKKMLLFNVYDIRSWEDIIYYTYYTLEQFGFSPAETRINLGGYSESISEVTTAFQKYSNHIFHLKAKGIEPLNSSMEDKIINTIFDLQCG